MNAKVIFGNACLRTVTALVAGLTAGWLIFGRSTDAGHEQTALDHAAETQVWTCSMHPQIKQNKPGKCPLCAMDLVPLKNASPDTGAADPDAILLSDEAVALAGIQTAVAGTGNPVREIRLYGTIQPDERLVHSQVSHISGRIEKLLVNFTGETVRYGQVIASVYSPDLQTAQQELLEAAKFSDLQPALLDAAREKLRRWKLPDARISAIEQSGVVSPLMDITANTGGIVLTRNVSQGDYVTQGSVLFSVADLSSVWAVFDAYEADLPYLKTGENITYTVQALPGRTFSGKITFINPILNETSRTVKVRVETASAGGRLKPGMYAGATVQASSEQDRNKIMIPKTAVLWTGKRSIVYVKQADSNVPAFRMREVELGSALGDSYVILSGLEAGEEVVVNGAFTIDATAQLEGKPSMMNNFITGRDMPSAAGSSRTEPGVPADDRQAIITVQGLCGMCKERIEKAAKSVDGVLSASWDANTLQLYLDFDPAKTNADAVGKAVAEAGHDTEKYKADSETYRALPECCRYRE
jgi:Cu(I)/Ag(I) efflux system membrane fusion protein